MAGVGGPLDYYWRTISNADYGSSFIGYWHVLALFSLVSALFLAFLAFLVLKADSSKGKNRFMAAMLLTEAVRCSTAMLFWVYSWPEAALDFLSNARVVYYTMSLQLFVLYVVAPTFYAQNDRGKNVSNFFSKHGLYALPVFCFLLIYVLMNALGGRHEAIGDVGWTYCASVGTGEGTTSSGNPMPFAVNCPESWNAVYPMTLSSPTLGPLTQALMILPTMGAVFAAVKITKHTKETENNSKNTIGELKAVRLGFVGKAILQIATIVLLMTLIGVLGERPTLDTHPFNPDDQVPRILIAVGPLLPTTVVLAALFEGLVFTYAVVKNDMFGVDEKLRKGFITASFTGLFAVLFLVGTEAMEAVFDRGWLGGIIIGLPLIVLRNPILLSLSKLAKRIMPQSFTQNELIYIETYKTAMSDGIITEKEQSMLDIQANSYGLTASRREFLETYTMQGTGTDEDI